MATLSMPPGPAEPLDPPPPYLCSLLPPCLAHSLLATPSISTLGTDLGRMVVSPQSAWEEEW